MKIWLRSRRCVTDHEQAFAKRRNAGTAMSGLTGDAPQNLSAASKRLAELHDRMRAAGEWCASLLILGAVLWLAGSRALAFPVAAGAAAAVVIGALAADERRRMLFGLVVQGDATSIPAVRTLADRLANDPGARHRVAAGLRTAARADQVTGRTPTAIASGRAANHARRMLALADAIDDPRRTASPAAVALCRTLLTDGASSPLYNPNVPESELDRVLAVVEAGIAPPELEREDRSALPRGQRPAAG
jgi:hypothetical protein